MPPPVIFIELWKINDRAIRTFDKFITKVNGQQYKYHCLGTIKSVFKFKIIFIPFKNHFNTVII